MQPHHGLVRTPSGLIDTLPSWYDGPVKDSILTFVNEVTAREGPSFVPPEERIAVFDNDGTLWCEQPLPVQGLFLFDRLKVLLNDRPELREKPPFSAVASHDRLQLAQLGKKGLAELFYATHTGMTTEQFSIIATRWLHTALHPQLRRPVLDCAFQPMLELLELLKRAEFTCFVVTGGGVDFVRACSHELYGIPKHQVIGTRAKTKIEVEGERFDVIKLAQLDSFDDRESKVLNIEQQIGSRPIFAFGNSDGDLAMLHYTAAGNGKRFVALLHHDDAAREYAYDRNFAISPLSQGLVEAAERGWMISMKECFAEVFTPWPRVTA
jgi:phosphoserine phosphatase